MSRYHKGRHNSVTITTVITVMLPIADAADIYFSDAIDAAISMMLLPPQ